jgi:hypothetical protein
MFSYAFNPKATRWQKIRVIVRWWPVLFWDLYFGKPRESRPT